MHKKYQFYDVNILLFFIFILKEEITLEENALDIFENVIAKYLNNLNDGA